VGGHYGCVLLRDDFGGVGEALLFLEAFDCVCEQAG